MKTAVDGASAACMHACRDALPDVPEAAVDGMVEAEPRILNCDIALLLSEIKRLLPGQSPEKLLVENPSVRSRSLTAIQPPCAASLLATCSCMGSHTWLIP